MAVRVSRRAFLQGGTLATAGLVLAACGATTSSTKEVRTIKLAGGQYGYPSPWGMVHGSGYLPMSLLFDTLTWQDADKLEPWLAKSWTISSDHLTYTFKLRSGVTFSDGTPLTAEDCAFSALYIKKNPIPWSISTYLFAAASAPDKETFVLKLKSPYAPLIGNDLAAMPIVPKHVWQGVADPTKKQDQQALIGTGAYTLSSIDLAQGTYKFSGRKKFMFGEPHFSTVEFVPAANVLLALKNGDIDVGEVDGGTGVSESTLQGFTGSTFGRVAGGGDTATAVYFNCSSAPYNDPSVRQAIAMALNRPQFVERAAEGLAKVGSPGFLPQDNPFYDASVAGKLPFDVNRAKSLLAGRSFTMNVVIDSTLGAVGQLMTSQLAQVGITVNLQPVEFSSLQQTTASGKYDVAVFGFGGLSSDPSFVLGFFDSAQPTGKFTQVVGYSNAQYNQLVAEQAQQFDAQKRQALLNQIQGILAADVPVLVLYYPTRNLVYRKSVSSDAWYFTPGGFAGGNPGGVQKGQVIFDRKTGLTVAS